MANEPVLDTEPPELSETEPLNPVVPVAAPDPRDKEPLLLLAAVMLLLLMTMLPVTVVPVPETTEIAPPGPAVPAPLLMLSVPPVTA